MFADEPYPLYNRIALPPMLRKQIPEAKVIIRNEAWHEQHTIDLRLSTRVDAINYARARRRAGGKEYPYDALLIATGGRPNASEFPGATGAEHLQLPVHGRHAGDFGHRSKPARCRSAGRSSPTNSRKRS